MGSYYIVLIESSLTVLFLGRQTILTGVKCVCLYKGMGWAKRSVLKYKATIQVKKTRVLRKYAWRRQVKLALIHETGFRGWGELSALVSPGFCQVIGSTLMVLNTIFLSKL